MALDIYIIGSGAMGCLWASYFVDGQTPNGNLNLHFIQRNKQQDWLEIEIKPHNKTLKARCHSYDELSPGAINHLIIATKAFDALSGYENVQPFLSDKAQILLLQNGMGSQQSIAKAIDPNSQQKLYACSSTEGAYKESYNVLIHAGFGENHIGPMNDRANAQDLNQWLAPNHFSWHNNIEPILWKKLVVNCAINPLTVLYQCQNGELIKNPDYLQHMQNICTELDSLMKTLQLPITNCFDIAKDICKLTANNFSSMYQDAKFQRPTELEFITGYLLKTCKQHQVSCPFNQALYNQLKT